MSEAIASFRFRLREASRLALELGDKLLQLSQDAVEPNQNQLTELRHLEQSLDVNTRYRMPDIAQGHIRDTAPFVGERA
jgi:hypothetical protein